MNRNIYKNQVKRFKNYFTGRLQKLMYTRNNHPQRMFFLLVSWIDSWFRTVNIISNIDKETKKLSDAVKN